jgi:hypothetical protein
MVTGGATVFGLSMHPEIITHNKIKAHIFGFAMIPPQFFSNVRYSEKAFGQRESR